MPVENVERVDGHCDGGIGVLSKDGWWFVLARGR